MHRNGFPAKDHGSRLSGRDEECAAMRLPIGKTISLVQVALLSGAAPRANLNEAVENARGDGFP
jgi:hypothetical protein